MQRFTILATGKMLRQLQQKAAVSRVSKRELIRSAIDAYDPSAAENEAAIQTLFLEIRNGTKAANQALDEAEDELGSTRKSLAGTRRTTERA